MSKGKRRRKCDDRRVWCEAVVRYGEAEAAYLAIRDVFNRAEGVRSAILKERGEVTEPEKAALARQTQIEEIEADHAKSLKRWCAAMREVLNTRAPDLAGVIWKLELVREIEWDEDIDWMILTDLKRLDVGSGKSRRRP
jgi:hypothetical protein